MTHPPNSPHAISSIICYHDAGFRCGRSSPVECLLPKENVVGPTPIARSPKLKAVEFFCDKDGAKKTTGDD